MAPRRILFAERRPVESLKLSERARIRNREIGFISQAINLVGDITVYENVEPPLTSWGSTEGKRRTLEVLGQRGQIVRISNSPQRDDELFRRLTSINRRQIDGAERESVRSRGE